MKYKDNMTPDELAKFMREYNELESAYANAATHDAAQAAAHPPPEDWEDEMEYWRKAGLDFRGRP